MLLKTINPNGRWWIKLDATDIKAALLESMEGEWNGDQNLLLGVLDALEEEYQSRCHAAEQGNVPTIKHDLEQDVTWLLEFLGKLSKAYEKKLKTRINTIGHNDATVLVDS